MKTNDGRELSVGDPHAIVSELRRISHTATRTNAEFMREAAGRALLQNGARVRHDTPENFIADLVQAGLLTEE